MSDAEKPEPKQVVVVPVAVRDRGAKAEPAWRAGTENFKPNKLGRAE